MHVDGSGSVRVLIGGIATAVLFGSGVAAVTAWMPNATDGRSVAFVLDKVHAGRAGPKGDQAQAPPLPAGSKARSRAKCQECGIVRSTRLVSQLGGGIDPSAAVGMTNSGRREMRVSLIESYEVTVAMRDGSSYRFVDSGGANWRPGDGVLVIRSAGQRDKTEGAVR